MPRPTVFTAFNFIVDIRVPGVAEQICEGAFAECDGLELTLEPKTFNEGGNNSRQIHLAGAATYSQLTLKRGMSKDNGLWRWANTVMRSDGRGTRGQATITYLSADGSPQIFFKVYDCLPTKLRAPALNAGEGGLAIEELTLVYAGFDVEFAS